MTTTIKPRVTVVITTYNRASTLRYAIESVLWQKFRNIELWVIGAGCTDASESIVNSFDHDPRVHWHNLPGHSGDQQRAHDEAIRRARGEYIAYLNQDDIWLPDHLEKLVEHMDRTQADIAFTIIQWVYSFTYSRPDIPLLPDLPIPPDSTAVMLKKSIIGCWRDIRGAVSFPAKEFFRQARFAGLKLEMVPATTGLKFFWDPKNGDPSPQSLYMDRMRNEPDFMNRELSAMLIRAEQKLNHFPGWRRLLNIFSISVRRLLIKLHVDPSRAMFWQAKERRSGNDLKKVYHPLTA